MDDDDVNAIGQEIATRFGPLIVALSERVVRLEGALSFYQSSAWEDKPPGRAKQLGRHADEALNDPDALDELFKGDGDDRTREG